MIYFIRAGATDKVKIGNAKDPIKRLEANQTFNPETLLLVRVCQGRWKEEVWLHRHYSDRHYRGEWFFWCDDMLTIDIGSAAPRARTKVYTPEGLTGLEAIKAHRGLCTIIANELKINTGAIAQWKQVPGERLIAIEKASGIPREILRPDLYKRFSRNETGATP